MRSLVAILIALLLPLQWSFAAIDSYCQHEVATAKQSHVGHHDHDHALAVASHNADQPGGKDADPRDTGGFVDLDCPSCHVSFLGIVLMAEMPSLPAAANVPTAWCNQLIPNRSPDNPFRPPHTAGA